MTDSDLTAFQASQLQFLRQQVDKYQDERWRRGASTAAHNDLFAAREELKNFVKNLREGGKII